MADTIGITSANNTLTPVDTPHSLQSLIELTYVQSANDVLYNHLQSLQSALGTTQTTIGVLTQLQNLHNDVTIHSTGNFNSAASFANEATYKAAASAFFGQPVRVSASFAAFGTAGFRGFLSAIVQVRTELSTQIIPALSATQTRLPNGAEDPNSLLGQIRVVLADLKKNNITASASQTQVSNWIIDGYNNTNATGSASAGVIQGDLTAAMTAGESLNTTQTEAVRNYLFLFQEYYQSATAILQQLTQLIQKMADGINR